MVSIYQAARTYQEHDTPVVVIAGKDYGAGSSRDWAAKGPKLLGVRAILAESFERIHRANLVGMGIYYGHGGVLPSVLRTVLNP